MTDSTCNEQILKTDVLGRVKTPRQRREALLDEFERSGMSGTKFAGFVGMRYQTFASWIQKRRRQRAVTGTRQRAFSNEPVDTPPKLQWVEAVVEKENASAGKGMLSVHLPGGARMEVGDARQAALAAELLRALGSQRPC